MSWGSLLSADVYHTALNGCLFCVPQTARLARIHTVKTQSCTAFIQSKIKAQQRLMALEAGSGDDKLVESLNDQDLFQLQHHHLLSCLERTTVSLSLSLSLSLSHSAGVTPSTAVYLCVHVC